MLIFVTQTTMDEGVAYSMHYEDLPFKNKPELFALALRLAPKPAEKVLDYLKFDNSIPTAVFVIGEPDMNKERLVSYIAERYKGGSMDVRVVLPDTEALLKEYHEGRATLEETNKLIEQACINAWTKNLPTDGGSAILIMKGMLPPFNSRVYNRYYTTRFEDEYKLRRKLIEKEGERIFKEYSKSNILTNALKSNPELLAPFKKIRVFILVRRHPPTSETKKYVWSRFQRVVWEVFDRSPVLRKEKALDTAVRYL